jgi:hypothetical protein
MDASLKRSRVPTTAAPRCSPRPCHLRPTRALLGAPPCDRRPHPDEAPGLLRGSFEPSKRGGYQAFTGGTAVFLVRSLLAGKGPPAQRWLGFQVAGLTQRCGHCSRVHPLQQIAFAVYRPPFAPIPSPARCLRGPTCAPSGRERRQRAGGFLLTRPFGPLYRRGTVCGV